MTVKELEKAVANLSPQELAEFRAWFQDMTWTNGTSRSRAMQRRGSWINSPSYSRLQGRAREGAVRHFTNAKFWAVYHALPVKIQRLADKNFQLMKADPRRPSIQLKKAGRF